MIIKIVTIASYVYLLISSLILARDMSGANDDVFIAPAGFAFAIWGLIYLLLLISLVRQFTADEQDQKPKAVCENFILILVKHAPIRYRCACW
ncbi:hypothetical protein ABFG93_13085 [Pseudalkalibacillus hwajinpoensis]|uniref:hypothetical protein n=1 Tax=Guptibacillus hwajinpoensis TaxID=208199 RepID=UPI00325AD65C